MHNTDAQTIKEFLYKTGQKEFCSFLLKTDYLTAPASTKYHSSYEGGLVDHSVRVTKNLLYLTNKLSIKWDRPESPYIIGMFHDLCKVNFYKRADKWTKDDKGKWITIEGFDVDEKEVLGHGDKSCYFILLNGGNLTLQEIYCIRNHMGPFGLGFSDQTNFSNACKKHPEILYVCLADHMAGIAEESDVMDENILNG